MQIEPFFRFRRECEHRTMYEVLLLSRVTTKVENAPDISIWLLTVKKLHGEITSSRRSLIWGLRERG